jgi:hypothetical protein
MAVRSLRHWGLPGMTFPTGVVVVQAPRGWRPERWMPVFM